MRRRTFFYDINFGVFKKSRHIHTNLAFASIVIAIPIVLKTMKTRIIQTSTNSDLFYAYKGWSILSDGEVLTISIQNYDNSGGIEIIVQSESAFPKLWDLGVNNRNLKKFARLFRSIEQKPDILNSTGIPFDYQDSKSK